MPLPKEVTFVTFDVYGTLIDWETGAYDAFAKEAEKDGYTLSSEELVPLFLETQQEIKGGSYELYAEVLRRTAVQISRQLGWPLEPSRSGLPARTRSRAGRRSRRPTPSSSASRKKFELGLISNIDDKLLGETRRHFKTDFDLVVTAQQVRSYKPDPAHFKEAERRIGTKKGWVHVASSYYYDVEPCIKAKIPVIWVNRNKEQLDAGAEEADGRGQERCSKRRSCSARRRLRAVGLHADVIAATSRAYATTCTLVRSAARRSASTRRSSRTSSRSLPAIAEQAGFSVVGAARHARRLGPPARPLRVPGGAAGCGRDDRGAAGRRARRGAARAARLRRGVLRRAAAAAVAAGRAAAARAGLHRGRRRGRSSCIRPTGHTADGMAIWVAVGARAGGRRLPVAGRDPDGQRRRLGDRLHRDAEPARAAGRAGRARRARPRRRRSTAARALAILREDRAYLEALLADGEKAKLPIARNNGGQRKIHAENVAHVSS